MRYWLVVFAATLAACGGSSSAPPSQPVVEDTTPPIITLTGDNPQLVEAGEAYTELGATATDNIDGDLSASIVIDASTVDTTVPGDYTVTYDVSDSSDNAATTVTRTVTVQDTTSPVITLLGDDPQVIVTGDPYMELGATASDSLDGDLTAAILIDASAVDTDISGSYTVSYVVLDNAGNMDTVSRTIRVLITGSWKLAGYLNYGMEDHRSALLNDGRVLFVSQHWDEPAQLFDPTSGQFLTIAATAKAHGWGLSLTVLADGRVLIAGGGYPGGAAAEVFNPITGEFLPVNSLNVPRRYHTATLLANGQVLIVGGQTGNYWEPVTLSSAELFDPSTGTFVETGSLNEARGDHCAVLLRNGAILIVHGVTEYEYGDVNRVESAELFEPSIGEFRHLGVAPADETWPGECYGSVLLPSGDVLLTGSVSSIFDSTTEKFRPTDQSNILRTRHGAVALTSSATCAGPVLVVGGSNRIFRESLGSVELFDPVLGQYFDTSNLLTDRWGHSATRLLDGRVLIAGGWHMYCCDHASPDPIEELSVEIFEPVGECQ